MIANLEDEKKDFKERVIVLEYDVERLNRISDADFRKIESLEKKIKQLEEYVFKHIKDKYVEKPIQVATTIPVVDNKLKLDITTTPVVKDETKLEIVSSPKVQPPVLEDSTVEEIRLENTLVSQVEQIAKAIDKMVPLPQRAPKSKGAIPKKKLEKKEPLIERKLEFKDELIKVPEKLKVSDKLIEKVRKIKDEVAFAQKKKAYKKQQQETAASPLYSSSSCESFAEMTAKDLNIRPTKFTILDIKDLPKKKPVYTDKLPGLSTKKWAEVKAMEELASPADKKKVKEKQIRHLYRGLWIRRSKYLIECYDKKYGENAALEHPYLGYTASRAIEKTLLGNEIDQIYVAMLHMFERIISHTDKDLAIKNDWYIETKEFRRLK